MPVFVRSCSLFVLALALGCAGQSGGGSGQGGASGAGGQSGNNGARGGSGGNAAGSGGTAGGAGAAMGGRGGSNGTGGNPDAGAGNDTNAAAWPPPGTVAMFVVAGTQGRNVLSCDDGLTWKAHDVPVTTGEEFNEKGLAFGHGVFMQVMGWGGKCSFLRTEDGVNWERITLAAAGLPDMSECGGITYNGDGFTMVHWGGAAYASDHDGRIWHKVGMFDNNNEHVREIAGDGPSPGIVLAGGANDPGGGVKNPPHVSVDGGKTWKATPGCSTLHAISVGQEGGGALGAGRMVYVGYLGEVCTSTDMTTWQEAQLPGLNGGYLQGKVNFDGNLFWAASNDRVFVSSNGTTWTVRTLPANVRLHAVAKSNTGVWVGFDRGATKFFRSTDGMNWTAATTNPADGPDLYRIAYGYGKPSAECPLR